MRTSVCKFSFLFLAGISLLLTSCDPDDEPETPVGPAPGSQSIAAITTTNGNYSILGEALGAAGLYSILEGGSFTVFAPSNDAFNRLFDDLELTDANADGSRVDELVGALGGEAVRDILLYHVLDGVTLAENVPVKAYVKTLCLASSEGRALDLLLESRSDRVLLNSGSYVGRAQFNTRAEVVAPNILATNGVVHGVNAVMLLPNVLDVTTNNSDFSGFANLAALAGVIETLEFDTVYTVFAPSNAAFELANDSLLMAYQLAQFFPEFEIPAQIALHHVHDFEVLAEDLNDFIYYTYNTQDLFVTPDVEVTTVESASGVIATIIPSLTNIQATNGVVHGVTRVLFPVIVM
jgi:transforming growth factor-beta-induced protein